MYTVAHHTDHDLDRAELAAAGRRAASDAPLPAAVRRAACGVSALLLAAALLGCGDHDAPWGSTETADRSAPTQAEQRASPPPTPDYRKLVASAEQDEASTDDDGQEAASGPEPLPRDVTYPEAESLYHAGDYGRAVRHFRVYARENPDNPWGHYMLGLSAWKAGERERAVGALEDALRRDPDHVKSLVNLSRVLLELDRPDEARERIRQALELAPEAPDVLRVAGNVADEAGDGEAAIRRYRQALAADGSDAWSANNLGLLLVRRGRYEDALGPLARAVRLRPEVDVIRNNLGVALERTGHLEQAREQYRQAADAGHEKAEASLARLDGHAGDREAGPVDIDALARGFAERADGWSVDAVASRPGGSPSETRPDSARGGTAPEAPTEEETNGGDPTPSPEEESGTKGSGSGS